jgi:hypothetical protein
MALLEQGIRTLIENEFISLLVFALVFTIVFAVERKMHLFAKKDDKESLNQAKKVHSLIALVFGILSVLPHYTMTGSKYDIVLWASKFLPQISLIAVTIIGVLLLLGIVGMNVTGGKAGNPLRLVFFFILLGIVLWMLFGTFGAITLPNWITPNIMAVVIVLAVFGFVVSFIMSDPDKKKNKKSFQENFDEFIEMQNKK